MSIKPFNDRILIYQTKAPDHFTATDGVSNSKIIIPDEIKNKLQPNIGLVLDFGEDVKGIEKGTTILFEKWAGADVELLNNDGVVIKNLKMVKREDLISQFVDDKYFYDDLLKPLREEEKRQKKADDENRKLLWAEKQKQSDAIISSEELCNCEILCQECGLKEDIKLKWLDSFAVDDSNLPECSMCKKKSMKLSAKNIEGKSRIIA